VQAGDGGEGAPFRIDIAATTLQESMRAEPFLAGGPAPAEIDEMARLDPNRATPERDPPPLLRRQLALSFSVLGSLGVHLLPMLLLLDWSFTPAEIAAPIPVQLVIEEPPPLPPKPEEFKPPPPGRLASDDIGQTASPPPEAAAATPPAPSQPAATQMAAMVPPPPSPPTPTQMAAMAPPPPKPIRPPKPAFTWHRLDILPQDSPRETRVPGPAASRDEYLAYCMVLIRRHFGLLSPAFLAGRRGAAAFKIVVLDDGRIAGISVAQGSAFPDVDARIEQAVNAVRRFPPLPQWLQGSSAGLILQVVYPDGL
jgi:TonB family protein